MPRKALGKGLEALFPSYQEKVNEEIHEIPVTDIFPNRQQPRQNFDDQKLEELAASIKIYGVIQPIFLKRHVHGYEIVAGERRWRAAKKAGITKVPAIIRDVAEDKKLEISLIENIQRENLNPIEEGQAYKLLMDQFSYTQQDLADKIGKDRSTVANMLRLLKLPEKVKKLISDSKISMGHARAILGIVNEENQIVISEKIIKKGLSVRETESLVNKLQKEEKEISSDIIIHIKDSKDSNILSIEEKLSKIFGTKVRISCKKERGKIEIKFKNNEEFERILEIVKNISS